MFGTSTYSRLFSPSDEQRDIVEKMDREHIKGAAKKARGAVKETVGKFIGSEKVQTEGKLDKAKSAMHTVAGDVRDAARHGAKSQNK
jgi:uncharacterized protein YjbJ (UPF0337 family)